MNEIESQARSGIEDVPVKQELNNCSQCESAEVEFKNGPDQLLYEQMHSTPYNDSYEEHQHVDKKEIEVQSTANFDDDLEEQELESCSEEDESAKDVKIEFKKGHYQLLYEQIHSTTPNNDSYEEHQHVDKKEIEIQSTANFDDDLEEQELESCSEEDESAKDDKNEFKKGPYQLLYEQLYGTPFKKPYDPKYLCNERGFLTEEELKRFPDPPKVSTHKEHEDAEKLEDEVLTAKFCEDVPDHKEDLPKTSLLCQGLFTMSQGDILQEKQEAHEGTQKPVSQKGPNS
ncbi:hypothetical protein JTE90_006426 [Oedothorax gibbosus]|uniref:Uncharacterized protein n=1 Tax=Oedothorax gibbosus TaxID=931172 RepID=A0AAV6TXZ1_9ARAC|nr:hypothetical protein JTE90_006426 [Oedothorax gibbosus]